MKPKEQINIIQITPMKVFQLIKNLLKKLLNKNLNY